MVSIPRSEGRALYRSGVGRVPCRPPFLLGVVPSQTPRGASRMRKPKRHQWGWGEGFASPRLGPKRSQGRPRTVFCLGRHSHYHPRFITPCKDTSSTRSRAAAPAPRARRVVRAAVGDAAAPFRWLTGSMDGGGSRRSLVGTSRLAPQCHGWRRSSRRMRSLGSSCAPLGGGLHHTRGPSTAQHDRLAPPVRRVALRADRRW